MFSNSVSSWFVFSSQPAHQTADYSEGCIHEIAKVLAGGRCRCNVLVHCRCKIRQGFRISVHVMGQLL